MIPARGRPGAPRDRWIFAATLVLIVWLPLPWGSHRPWAADLIVAASALLLGLRLALIAAGATPSAPGLARQLTLPALWWLLWLTWIGLQLQPVSGPMLELLSPESARLHGESGALLGQDARLSVSIGPSETVDAWLLSAGYACLYVLVVLLCHGNRERMGLVLGVIVISGLAQAVFGSLMVLSGLEWGFFTEKQYYRGVATGTFVNRNHLAGYLELTGAAALGLVLADLGRRDSGAQSLRQRTLDLIALAFSTKMRARLALVVMAIALVLTRSRMGNIAFFSSLCICGMAFILLRRRTHAMRAFVLFASVVAIDILVVSNWYGLERVVERIERTDLGAEGRFVFLSDVSPAIDAYRFTGSGLGTFAYAFAPYRSPQMSEFFDHAHNDYIEFFIETGIIGVALLATFALCHVVHALRVLVNRRRRMAAAVGFSALMGLSALAIHGTADFNLQIPANAATLLVLMALSASCTSTSSRRPRPTGGGPDMVKLDAQLD